MTGIGCLPSTLPIWIRFDARSNGSVAGAAFDKTVIHMTNVPLIFQTRQRFKAPVLQRWRHHPRTSHADTSKFCPKPLPDRAIASAKAGGEGALLAVTGPGLLLDGDSRR